MKKIISTIIIFSLFTAIFPFGVFAESGNKTIRNDVSGIPDKGLYRAILHTLIEEHNIDVSNGTFTQKDVEKITQFSAFGKKSKEKNIPTFNIKNLKGIENLTNLNSLYIGYNNLTDASGIEKLIKLEELALAHNKLKKLPNMKSLKMLNASYTSFVYNKLSKKELERKLPKNLVGAKTSEGNKWFHAQYKLQNVNTSIKLKSPESRKKITVKTNKIIGKAHKNVHIRLRYWPTQDPDNLKWINPTIKEVRTDKKGNFHLTRLNLKKYRRQRLTLEVLCKDKYHATRVPIASVNFTVKK